MKRRNARRIICVISILVLTTTFVMNVATCEQGWDCPECGRTGNTGNYCGGCAHPAPWIETENEEYASSKEEWMKAPLWPDSVFAFSLSIDETDQRVKELLQEAACWDAVSCPQTIDDFPLLPENFSDIYDAVLHVENSLSISSKTECSWKTGLRDLFDSIGAENRWISCCCPQTGGGAPIPSSYVSVNNDSYVLYISQLLDGCSSEDLSLIGLNANWQGSSSFKESIFVEYHVEHGGFTGEAKLCILMQNSGYYIEWIRGFDQDYDGEDEDIIHILMTDLESGRTYDVVYHPGTRQKIRFISY